MQQLRRRWAIQPQTRLPPSLSPRTLRLDSTVGYLPERWPDHGELGPTRRASRPERQERPGPNLSDVLPPANWAEPDDGGSLAAEWWADIEALHDEVVPGHLTRPGRKAKPIWSPFLSACVLFDPPRDQLLAFADDHPGFADLPPDDEGWRAAPEPGEPAGALNPPVVWVRDARQTARNAYEAWVDTLEVVADRLREQGIDLWSLIAEAVREDRGLVLRARARDAATRRRPYIKVSPETTVDGAREAIRLLASASPQRRRAGRPPVDDLVAVQCYVWQHEFHRSAEEIAAAFEWGTQHVPGNLERTRSETVRAHVSEGERILRRIRRQEGES